MAGKKSITLLNKQGNPIGVHFRYKKLQSAVKKATALSISFHTDIQIWHLDLGKELAQVIRTRNKVVIELPHPTVFARLWADA